MSFFSDLEKFGENIAILQDNGESVTYSELCFFSDTLEPQVRQRTLVFILCTNSIASIAGYVAFLRNNIVPVLVDSKLDKTLLHHLVETYEPAYIWAPSGSLQDFEGVYSTEYHGYSLLRTSFPIEMDMYPELALLLTTSGSTGSPKLVRQSYKNIEANTNSIIEYLAIVSDDRPITTLPMSYTYGLSIINTHLQAGATILATETTLMQKEFWNFLKKEKATTFGGVPYTYQMLNRLRFFNMNLPSIRYITQAGGKLSADLSLKVATSAAEKGFKFVVMYGQTEATARMSYLPPDRAIDKYGSMGIAIPGGEFWIQDDGGNKITENEVVGELVYRGANVTLGYAEKKEDLALGDERGGILVTGDMAKRDADGFYYIVGRKKRFLKIFGSRVNLDETERLLLDKGYVCACTGVDDRMSVYTENQGKEQEIQKFLAELLSLNSSAFVVKYIESIPKNESGKTLYSGLENL